MGIKGKVVLRSGRIFIGVHASVISEYKPPKCHYPPSVVDPETFPIHSFLPVPQMKFSPQLKGLFPLDVVSPLALLFPVCEM